MQCHQSLEQLSIKTLRQQNLHSEPIFGQMHEKEIDKKIGHIKATQSKFGNQLPETEKSKLSTQLYALYSQAIEDTGDGKGGQGAGT